ncbi:MAG: hypothetical protein ABIJ45_01220, partial [Candidatus Zixiibacteriota bacterium]
SVVILTIICITANIFASEYPTDIGSVTLKAGFLLKKSDIFPTQDEQNSVSIFGTVEYFPIVDISSGIWILHENENSNYKYFGIGPQFKWYIGGHMHKLKFKGDILPYIGIGIHYSYRTVDTYNYSYEIGKIGGQLTFGTNVMILNHIGFFGECLLRMEGNSNTIHYIGDLSENQNNYDLRLQFGLSIFLY